MMPYDYSHDAKESSYCRLPISHPSRNLSPRKLYHHHPIHILRTIIIPFICLLIILSSPIVPSLASTTTSGMPSDWIYDQDPIANASLHYYCHNHGSCLESGSCQIIGESGLTTVTNEWTQVYYKHRSHYRNPVVIASTQEIKQKNPGVIRVGRVSSSGFMIRYIEYGYPSADFVTPYTEQAAWTVVEQGEWNLTNGRLLQAHSSLTDAQRNSKREVTFPLKFSSPPVVLTTINDYNVEMEPASIRIEQVDNRTFSMRRFPHKDYSGPLREQGFNWIALERSASYPTSGLTGIEVSDAPFLIDIANYRNSIPYNYQFSHAIHAADQTIYGGDPSVTAIQDVQLDSFKVFLLEEQVRDVSQGHTDEQAGFADFQSGSPLISGTITCDSPDYKGSYCNITTCFGVQSDLDTVCSAHGRCTAKDECVCVEEYTGPSCEYPICYGTSASDTANVCGGGRGACISPDTCNCTASYYGKQCLQYNCNGVHYNSSLVCSGHGECVNPDECQCESSSYGGVDCVPYCFGILSTNTSHVCGGHGVCTAYNSCVCDFGWNPATHCATYLPPVAVVEANRLVGPCDNLQLDAIRSYSRAGFDMSTIQYVWTSVSGPSKASITSHLVDNNLKERSLVIIPGNILEMGNHTLGITVRDGSGLYSDTVYVTVEKKLSTVPLLNIEGSLIQTIAPSEGLRLRAYIENGDACLSTLGGREEPTSTTWRQVGYSSTNDVRARMESHQQSVYIAPYSLYPKSSPYHFEVESVFASGQVLKRQVTVQVKNAPLVVRISGGSHTIQQRDNVELDIFSSVDYNLAPEENEAMFGGANIKWTCIVKRTNESCLTGGELVENAAKITIPGNALSAAGDGEHIIRVEYSKGGRHGSNDVVLSVVRDSPLSVLIQNPPLLNAHERFTLRGSVQKLCGQSCEIERVFWSVLSNNLLLNEDTVLLDGSNDWEAPFLVFRSNAFSPGEMYILRLSAVTVEGKIVSATTTVHVNQVPQGGTIQVSPASGVQLQTSFSATAYSWKDSHPPLAYQFEYYHRYLKRWEIYQPFSVGTVLGSFSIPFSGNALMRARIRNALNATTTFNFVIPVNAQNTTTELDQLNHLLESPTNGLLQGQTRLNAINQLLEDTPSLCESDECQKKQQEYRSHLIGQINGALIVTSEEIEHGMELLHKIVVGGASHVSNGGQITISNHSLHTAQTILSNLTCHHEKLNAPSEELIIPILSSIMNHGKRNGLSLEQLSALNRKSLTAIDCLKRSIHQRMVEGETAFDVSSDYYAAYVYRDLSGPLQSQPDGFSLGSVKFAVSSSLDTYSAGDVSSLSLSIVEFREEIFASNEGTTRLSNTVDFTFLHGEKGNEYPVKGIDPPNVIEFSGDYTVRNESFQLECRYYDESRGVWSAQGCKTVRGGGSDRVLCECSHLTSFALFEVEKKSSILPVPVPSQPSTPDANLVGLYVIIAVSGTLGVVLCLSCCCCVILVLCVCLMGGLYSRIQQRRQKVEAQKKHHWGSIRHAAFASKASDNTAMVTPGGQKDKSAKTKIQPVEKPRGILKTQKSSSSHHKNVSFRSRTNSMDAYRVQVFTPHNRRAESPLQSEAGTPDTACSSPFVPSHDPFAGDGGEQVESLSNRIERQSREIFIMSELNSPHGRKRREMPRFS